MNLLNQFVNHKTYGAGVICEITEHNIWVRFNNPIGKKEFLYPDAFDGFLQAADKAVERYVMEELHTRQEKTELECEKKRKEFEEHLAAAALERHKERSATSKKSSSRKKKSN